MSHCSHCGGKLTEPHCYSGGCTWLKCGTCRATNGMVAGVQKAMGWVR